MDHSNSTLPKKLPNLFKKLDNSIINHITSYLESRYLLSIQLICESIKKKDRILNIGAIRTHCLIEEYLKDYDVIYVNILYFNERYLSFNDFVDKMIIKKIILNDIFNQKIMWSATSSTKLDIS